MTVYDFTDLNAIETRIHVPTEAITFNGHRPDLELHGFRTLVVTGRDDINTTIQLFEGWNIDSFRHGKTKAESIEYKFQLISENYQSQQKDLTFLKWMFRGDDVEFSFADEEYTRRGTVSSFKIENTGSLALVGTVTIEQTSPYKYTQLKTLSTTDRVFTNIFEDEEMYQPQVESIEWFFSIPTAVQNRWTFQFYRNYTDDTGQTVGDILATPIDVSLGNVGSYSVKLDYLNRRVSLTNGYNRVITDLTPMVPLSNTFPIQDWFFGVDAIEHGQKLIVQQITTNTLTHKKLEVKYRGVAL